MIKVKDKNKNKGLYLEHFVTVISQMYHIETYSESSAKPKAKASPAFQSYEPSR